MKLTALSQCSAVTAAGRRPPRWAEMKGRKILPPTCWIELAVWLLQKYKTWATENTSELKVLFIKQRAVSWEYSALLNNQTHWWETQETSCQCLLPAAACSNELRKEASCLPHIHHSHLTESSFVEIHTNTHNPATNKWTYQVPFDFSLHVIGTANTVRTVHLIYPKHSMYSEASRGLDVSRCAHSTEHDHFWRCTAARCPF